MKTTHRLLYFSTSLILTINILNPVTLSNTPRHKIKHDLIYYVKNSLLHNGTYEASIENKKISLLESKHIKSIWKPTILISAEIKKSKLSLNLPEIKSHGYAAWIGFRQHIYNPGDRAKIAVSINISSLAEIKYKKDKEKIIQNVSNAYFNVLETQQLLNLIKSDIKMTNFAEKSAGLANKVNMLTISQVYEAKANKLQTIALKAEIAHNLFEARAYLEFLSGAPANRLAPLRSRAVLTLPTPRELAYWKNSSQHNNLELRLTQRDIELKRNILKVTACEKYPTLNLLGGYYFQNNNTPNISFGNMSFNLPNSTNSTQFYAVQLTASVPIYSEKLNYNKHKIQIELTKEILVHDTLLKEVQLETENYYLKLAMYKKKLTSSLAAIHASKQAYIKTKNEKQNNRKTLMDLLIAEATLSKSRRTYTESKYNYIKDKINLLKITGQLNLKNIAQLNKLL